MHFLEEVKFGMSTNEVCPNAEEHAMPDESSCTVESKSSVTTPSLSPYSSDERRLPMALFPPVTPDPDRETSGDQHMCPKNLLSPLSSRSNPPITSVENPKDCVFDSFALDPNKFIIAPYQNKYAKEFPVHAVRRRLSFEFDSILNRDICSSDGDCDDELNTEAEEQTLFELVCAANVDAIVPEENDRIHPKLANRVLDSDGFKTPDCVPRISRIAEMCPGAPRKAMNQQRNHVDKKVCRKLEF